MATTFFDGTNDTYSASSGWVCRLRSRFTDAQGGVWIVEIIDSHVTTGHGFSWPQSSPKTFQVGPDGFTWSMDGKADTFQTGPISSSVSFDLTVTDTDHDQIVDVIAGSNDGRFGVAVYSLNGTVEQSNSSATYCRPFWFGIMQNEAIDWFPYTHPASIRIEAHCGLALLNSIPYADPTTGDPYDSWETIGMHLKRCLSHLPTAELWGYTSSGTGVKQTAASEYGEGIVTHFNWFFDKTKHLDDTTLVPTNDGLGYIGAHSTTFYNISREQDVLGGTYTRSEAISCGEVLKNILAVLQLRMVQYGGTFLLHNPGQAGQSTYLASYPTIDSLSDQSISVQNETTTGVELYASDFEQISGVKDSFFVPTSVLKKRPRKRWLTCHIECITSAWIKWVQHCGDWQQQRV